MTVLLVPDLKLERENDDWSKNVTILKYIKEWVYLYVYMCDREVLNGVSFWLCVLNSPGVCQSLDHASSSSLSWCCDDGDGRMTDACSPLCPSLEPSAWRTKKIEMSSQILIMQLDCTLLCDCNVNDTCLKGTLFQSLPLRHAIRNFTGFIKLFLSFRFTFMFLTTSFKYDSAFTERAMCYIWHVMHEREQRAENIMVSRKKRVVCSFTGCITDGLEIILPLKS